MNIDNLTFDELKQITAMFSDAYSTEKQINPMIGMYCIARCNPGIHAGEVASVDGENVILKDSRRLWQWEANYGTLSGVAQHGIKSNECKVDTLNPLIYLTGLYELIPCTKVSKESINA